MKVVIIIIISRVTDFHEFYHRLYLVRYSEHGARNVPKTVTCLLMAAVCLRCSVFVCPFLAQILWLTNNY